MNLRVALGLAAGLSLFSAGCDLIGNRDGVMLDEADAAAVETTLIPRFLILQDLQAEIPDALEEDIVAVAAEISAAMREDVDLQVLVTREPDADSGCLAGGRLFISRGLLSWIRDRHELAGALALSATACASTSARWRSRHEQGLPVLDESDPLMQRYRDYRLAANAPLYNQVVATGCGAGADCRAQAAQWLLAAGHTESGLDRLQRRVDAGWPDSAWLARFPASGDDGVRGSDRPASGSAYATANGWREGLEALVVSRNGVDSGDLRTAYQAHNRARNALDTDWAVRMNDIRISLANLHPENSQREMRTLEALWGDHPHSSYWWGMIQIQLRSTANGVQRLEESLEVLPRASAHYQIGRYMEFRQRPDRAVAHYRAVTAAGSLHPDAGSAAVRLAVLERE